MYCSLALNLPREEWPWGSDPPASSSKMLKWQKCFTISGQLSHCLVWSLLCKGKTCVVGVTSPAHYAITPIRRVAWMSVWVRVTSLSQNQNQNKTQNKQTKTQKCKNQEGTPGRLVRCFFGQRSFVHNEGWSSSPRTHMVEGRTMPASWPLTFTPLNALYSCSQGLNNS